MTKRIDFNQKQKSGIVERGRKCRSCGEDRWKWAKSSKQDFWRCAPCYNRFSRDRYRRNPQAKKNISWRKRGIDMTVERYAALEKEQGHACALCRKPTTRMVVDHDHETGQTRGLLCRRCNVLAQDPKVLKQVLQYVESFRQ
jgi:hypothetical protein